MASDAGSGPATTGVVPSARTAWPPRVLHLLAPAAFGGLEQVVRTLATAQARTGREVHVGAVLDAESANHPLVAALVAEGVHAYPLVLPPRAYRRERRLIRDLCTTIAPDVVHTHGYRADVLHAPVARRLGIPTVSTLHGFVSGDWKNRLYERLQRRAMRRCSAVVTVSRPMAQRLAEAGVEPARLHWIPNAWTGDVQFLERAEARRLLQIEAGAFCVGFIGRIGVEKGPDVFVESVGELHGDACGLLIGDGQLRAELEQRVRTLDLSGTIRFAGAIDQAGRLVRAFDVVVLSSRTEGTPMVLLEAMAAGVPVVATRVGGIPDVISADEAMLVAPERPGELAAAIRDVMRDPGAALQRAERARLRLAAELGADRWLERYDRVYQTCGLAAAGSRKS